MANRILKQYLFADMEITYLINDQGQVGMIFLPVSVTGKADFL